MKLFSDFGQVVDMTVVTCKIFEVNRDAEVGKVTVINLFADNGQEGPVSSRIFLVNLSNVLLKIFWLCGQECTVHCDGTAARSFRAVRGNYNQSRATQTVHGKSVENPG